MTSTDQLIDHLNSRQDFKPADWIKALEPRKLEEVEFHNFERERHDSSAIEMQRALDVHANKKYYTISTSSQAWVDSWIARQTAGRVFLDYACGNGQRTVQAAQAGAKLSIGLDISDVSILNARDAAKAAGVSETCRFIQGDCEATELPDNSIDVILCCGMLHHLELEKAYPELHRILRPGGRVLGVEALGHNPLIQLYREKTPHMRTEWETKHILRIQDIKRAEKWFRRGETRFWHLTVLGAVPFRNTRLFEAARNFGNLCDSILLRLPGVRLMAWQVTFELIKP